MDFDELRRFRKGIAGALDDLDVGRQMRELDVTRNLRELSRAADGVGEVYRAARDLQELNIAKSLRESDSIARSVREAESVARTMREMSVASSLPDSVLGLRAMDDPRMTGRFPELDRVMGGGYDQTRKYIEIEESFQRQVRQSLQDYERAGITAMIRELADSDWRRTIAEAAGQLRSAYTLARSSGLEELRSRGELLSDLMSGSPVLDMLAGELVRSAGAGALTPALAGGFGAEVIGYIEGAEAAESKEEAERHLVRIINWILAQARRLPAKELTKKALLALLGLFLAALITPPIEQWIYGDPAAREAKEAKEEARQGRHTDEAILRKLEELESRLGQPTAQDDTAREYVVIKAAKLRNGPGKKFEPLQVLPPNVQVEELGREGEWMHIEYFDYAEGELRTGWIALELLVEKRDDDQP